MARERAGKCSRRDPERVGDVENTAAQADALWPDRPFVIDKESRIAYAGILARLLPERQPPCGSAAADTTT